MMLIEMIVYSTVLCRGAPEPPFHGFHTSMGVKSVQVVFVAEKLPIEDNVSDGRAVRRAANQNHDDCRGQSYYNY